MASLTDTLCTQCGLCCDGSLFADVELSGRTEVTNLQILGLEVEEEDADGALLVLPCAALRGTRCGIYAHRPKTCRTFECRLLQEARRGTVEVGQAGERIAEALRRIARVKALLAQIGHRASGLPLREECAAALARGAASSPAARQRRAELEAAMGAADDWIRTTFLAEG